jgi:hypothetical protein
MNPELVSAIIGAVIVVWAAFAALRTGRSATRMGLLSGIGTAAMFVLLIRLVGPFGGWADWFVWVWLAGMAAIVVAVFRAALVWPELPWRAEDAKTRRSEAGGLGFSAVIALIIAAAMVVPGLFL